MVKAGEKGMAILIVLAMIFFIMLLGITILTIITSEFRLVQHKVARTQAYYAGMAGLAYVYNRLTVGAWPIPSANNFYVRYLCQIGSANCPGVIANDDIDEPNLPNTVNFVAIAVAGRGATAQAPIVVGGPNQNIPGCNPCAHPNPGVDACICARATYRD